MYGRDFRPIDTSFLRGPSGAVRPGSTLAWPVAWRVPAEVLNMKDLRPCFPFGDIRDRRAVNLDSAGLEVLSPGDCLSLAMTAPIGRIVFTEQALPAVQPVGFVIDDGCVIIRTTEGTKLADALHSAIVAFEVDDFDAMAETGWSVTVVGHAESVLDPREAARLARLPLRAWAPGKPDRFIRIRPEYMTGRRIRDRRGEAGSGQAGQGGT